MIMSRSTANFVHDYILICKHWLTYLQSSRSLSIWNSRDAFAVTLQITTARTNGRHRSTVQFKRTRTASAADVPQGRSGVEALHAATKRKLFSTVLRVVRRRHLAEEILQEAYVRIWLNAASYRSTMGSPMMWMITIARNLAIDVARKPTLEVYSDHSVMLDFPAEIPTALENIEIRESESETIKLRIASSPPCRP